MLTLARTSGYCPALGLCTRGALTALAQTPSPGPLRSAGYGDSVPLSFGLRDLGGEGTRCPSASMLHGLKMELGEGGWPLEFQLWCHFLDKWNWGPPTLLLKVRGMFHSNEL